MSKILKSSAADKTALTSGTDKKTVSGYGINIDILKLDSLKNKKNSFGMGDAQTSKHGFNLTGVKTQMTAPDDEVNKCVGHDIKKLSAANEHSVKTVLSSPTLDMNKYTSLNRHKFNYKLLAVGVVICLLFCVILLAGIVYTSAIFSKAITESAISGAADAVKMINENTPKPVESLDLEAVQVAPTSDDNGSAAYMGAIRNRYDEFASLTKAMPDEIEAFDSMIKYAVEKSKNKVLDSVFSGTDTANLMYAANGYNVWAYISDVKKITDSIEKGYSDENNNRKINIDPAILTLENFILVTNKNFTHRIYLKDGVFADLTLIYKKKKGYTELEWTYADYSSDETKKFLNKIRELFYNRLIESSPFGSNWK